MNHIYFQDSRNDANDWLGFLLSVQTPDKPKLSLQSATGGHTKLSANEQTLFWAKIQDSFFGVNVWRTLPQSAQINLLAHIHSADVQAQIDLSPAERRNYWAKWFLQALIQSHNTPLSQGLWALEYSDQENRTYNTHQGLQRHWRNLHSDPKNTAQFFSAHLLDIDWAMSGNGSIIPLFAPPMDIEHSGRVKWWRKVARDTGTLPPLLLWFMSGLDAYILLDGHDRLYASLLSGVELDYLILDSYTERVNFLDENIQNAVLKQLAIVEQKIIEGIEINPEAILGIQERLVAVFDDRLVRVTRTRATLNLSKEQWLKEVGAFTQKLKHQQPHQPPEWFDVDEV